ncbi:maleylpyruvate isomerase N-terminal domain-containing protein [Streptomyces pseudovenezuelae]|uniref:maleylpyruvate isomerase N-terminal domain-containing protein n=1 Tax=Streptomyces pseudovenezuelae TaxID=67350 RepID=UPI002E81BFBB|nr:maleylpyruvate isomerase N-terminal domain-containing protein [Streptomyces pseudovenezuelae]
MGTRRLRSPRQAVVRRLGTEESWRPTGCAGWAVRDLVFHCAGDAQRAWPPCARLRPDRPTGAR